MKRNFLLPNILQRLIVFSLKKVIIKRKNFKHAKIFTWTIQTKIPIVEDGHMKNILNLLNHLLIMEKNGKIFRNILVLEIVDK